LSWDDNDGNVETGGGQEITGEVKRKLLENRNS
jgi:hypothetical protein